MDFLLDLISTAIFEAFFDEITIVFAAILIGWLAFVVCRCVAGHKKENSK